MTVLKSSLSRHLPALAALAAAVVGLVNIASALTPNIRWRGHLLINFEPVQAIRLFHALALPAGGRSCSSRRICRGAGAGHGRSQSC
jgi:hypothetical protein